jgi:signal transduction histidine kinase/CheY-like chemotaxis protein
MSNRYAVACARALAFFGKQRDPSLLVLLRRIAWELLYLAPEGTADLALVVRNPDSRMIIGHAREHTALPPDTLKGLVLEHERRESVLLVKDHALDGASFVDAAPRSSVLCRLRAPLGISPRRECFLWLGLYAVAHPRLIQEARDMEHELTDWFEDYEGVVASIVQSATRITALEEKERELAAVLHDVRAPVGSLKYLLREISKADKNDDDIASTVSDELSYMESLLTSLSPSHVERARIQLMGCNVDEVVGRVVHRCAADGLREGVSISLNGALEGVGARIPDIEFERVLSNIIGNAIRYSKRGAVAVSVGSDRNRVFVKVRDTGPGIDPRILTELRGPLAKTVSSSSGWGMGLLSSKRRIEKYAGELCIASSTAHGTTIEIMVPRGSDISTRVAEPREARVERPPVESIDLVIVDDDDQQVSSLQRLLANSGLAVRGANSVAEAATVVSSASVKAVLCDAHMPDGGALQLIEMLKERGISSRVAVASGDGSEDLLYRCAAHGAREFFCKPVELGPLLSWVRSNGTDEDPATRVS